MHQNAIRNRSSHGDLLLWFEADDLLRQKLAADVKLPTLLPVCNSWLQPDSTAVAELATGTSPWHSVSVHMADGTPIDIPRHWVSHQDGSTHRFLHVVR